MLKSFRRTALAALIVGGALACPQMVLAHDLSVSDGWSRAGAPTARTGAAFVTLKGGHAAEDLVGAESPQAEKVELHTHLNDNGVMRMREVESIAILPDQATVLKPGGLHLMMFGLKAPLTEGSHFPMTLRFRNSPPITVEIAVHGAAAMGNTGNTADDHSHGEGEGHGTDHPPAKSEHKHTQ